MTKQYSTTSVVIPYEARTCQLEIDKRMQRYRFLVAVCHRRFGKTVSGVMWLIMEALKNKPDFRGYYIAPNQKQAKRLVWNYFKKFLANFVPHGLVKFNETELRIDFLMSETTQSIYLAGAENIENLRGVYMDAAVLDEMASWDKAEYAFFEVLYPAMSDRNGKGFIIGTVKGLDLFFDLYQMGLDKKTYPDWDSILYSVEATGVFTPEQIATLKNMMRDDAYDREYMCDFYAEAPDRLIRPQLVADAIVRVPNPQAVRASSEVWGFDVGYTGDPSILIKRKGPLVKGMHKLDNKDSVYQARWLARQIGENPPSTLYIDAGYGEGVIAQLNDLGFGHLVQPVFFNSASPSTGCVNMRAYMYWMLSKWLATGSIPNDEELNKQLSNVLLDDTDQDRRIKLKPKKEIKKVIRMSPDKSDALALTLAGGGEDQLTLEEVLADPSTVTDTATLKSIIAQYSGNNYDPDDFMAGYTADIQESLDNQW